MLLLLPELLLAVLYMSMSMSMLIVVFLPLGMVRPMAVESESVTWLREAAA